MEARNCANFLNLPEDALAVTEYTYGVVLELKERDARKVVSLGDIRLYECPLSYITPETWELVSLVYLVNDSKRLLYQGEWGNQPYWLVEATKIYKAESARQIKKEHGREKA